MLGWTEAERLWQTTLKIQMRRLEPNRKHYSRHIIHCADLALRSSSGHYVHLVIPLASSLFLFNLRLSVAVILEECPIRLGAIFQGSAVDAVFARLQDLIRALRRRERAVVDVLGTGCGSPNQV